MRRLRAAVARPIHIPLHPRAAARTPKAAPARRGGLDRPTHTTGFAGIRLVNPLHRHAHTRHLPGEGADELSMGPLTDLLVRLLAQTDPGLDLAHIPHRAAAHSRGLAERDDLARRLLLAVALLAVAL